MKLSAHTTLTLLATAGGIYGQAIREVPGMGFTPVELIQSGISRWILLRACPQYIASMTAFALALGIASLGLKKKLVTRRKKHAQHSQARRRSAACSQ